MDWGWESRDPHESRVSSLDETSGEEEIDHSYSSSPSTGWEGPRTPAPPPPVHGSPRRFTDSEADEAAKREPKVAAWEPTKAGSAKRKCSDGLLGMQKPPAAPVATAAPAAAIPRHVGKGAGGHEAGKKGGKLNLSRTKKFFASYSLSASTHELETSSVSNSMSKITRGLKRKASVAVAAEGEPPGKLGQSPRDKAYGKGAAKAITVSFTYVSKSRPVPDLPLACSELAETETLSVLEELFKLKLGLSYRPGIEIFDESFDDYLPLKQVADIVHRCEMRIKDPADGPRLQQLMKDMKNNVTVKDRRWRFRIYKNCFIATEAIDWMVSTKFAGVKTREEAVLVGSEMLVHRFITHVVDRQKMFQDKHLFFKYNQQRVDISAVEDEPLPMTQSVFMWGGDGALLSPTYFSSPVKLCQLSCGAIHWIAIAAETGQVYVWGSGESGQLGLGPDTLTAATPTIVPGLQDKMVSHVTAGRAQSGAIAYSPSGSQLYTWGWNGGTQGFEPRRVTFPDTDGSVTLVAMGSYNVCAVLQHTDSQACSLFSWGKNRHGQLGLGDCVTRRTPTLVRALEKRSIISVSAGDYHSACVTNKGDVYIWGDNSQVQLGVETHGQISNFPIKVPGLRNVTQISCGGSHTAAITSKGQLFTWGDGRFGRLGHADETRRNIPTQVTLLTETPTIVSCGHSHTLVATSSGSVYSFGDANKGKLGHGTLTNSLSPVKLDLPAKLVLVLCAGSHSSSALVVDDAVTLVAKALSGRFGSKPREADKLLEIFPGHLCERLQLLARDQLSRTLNSHGSSFMLNRMDRRSISRKTQLFDITAAPYRLDFNLAGEKCPVYKFVEQTITIYNDSDTKAFFKVNPLAEAASQFDIAANPPSGMLDKFTSVDIEIQLVLVEVCEVTGIFSVDVESGETGIRHFFTFSLQSEPFVHGREVKFEDIKDGEVLGYGASGFVTKVFYEDRWVAVKQFRLSGLNKSDIDSFVTEMLIACNLDHPNIVKSLGVCTQYPHLSLLLEYIPLGDLRDILTGHQVDTPLLLKIAYDVAEGMKYLHERKIMHRDLKCDNIMITSLEVRPAVRVNAKVTDFGASKVLHSSQTMSKDVGTVRYMPPEVLSRKSNTGEKIDSYSFGIVLWEMFAKGRLAFADHQFSWEVADAVCAGERPVVTEEMRVPAGMERLMRLCWDNNPDTRPTFGTILLLLLDECSAYPSLEFLTEDCTYDGEEDGASGQDMDNTIAILKNAMECNNEELESFQAQKEEYLAQIRRMEAKLKVTEANIRKCQDVKDSLTVRVHNYRQKIAAKRKSRAGSGARRAERLASPTRDDIEVASTEDRPAPRVATRLSM